MRQLRKVYDMPEHVLGLLVLDVALLILRETLDLKALVKI